MNQETNGAIYNWNTHYLEKPLSGLKQSGGTIKVHEETLRDGAQAAGIARCPLEEQISMVRLMDQIGIHRANVGFPSSSQIQTEDVANIALTKRQEGWRIELMCAARTVPADVQSIIDISQKTGEEIWAGIFLAGSELRARVMGWDLKEMAKKIPAPITLARKYNLPVMFVTEDTTRAYPETIKLYNQIAIDAGARQLCICDTVGFANPNGIKSLINYMQNDVIRDQIVDEKPVEIEFHGHNHRGFAWANTWAAIQAGVLNVEGTLLGIGEMTGNCPTEEIVLNAYLEGQTDLNPKLLNKLIQIYAEAIKVQIPSNWCVAGEYAYATGSGVHADAMLKGFEIGDPKASEVYCSYDPEIAGRKVSAYVGQMSGESSVIMALRDLGIQHPNTSMVRGILGVAKRRRTALSVKELKNLVSKFSPSK